MPVPLETLRTGSRFTTSATRKQGKLLKKVPGIRCRVRWHEPKNQFATRLGYGKPIDICPSTEVEPGWRRR